MLRQSNQNDRELHNVKITAKTLQIARSVNAVTLRFFSLLLSGSFGFANFFSSSEFEARSSDSYSLIVLVNDFDQLLTREYQPH